MKKVSTGSASQQQLQPLAVKRSAILDVGARRVGLDTVGGLAGVGQAASGECAALLFAHQVHEIGRAAVDRNVERAFGARAGQHGLRSSRSEVLCAAVLDAMGNEAFLEERLASRAVEMARLEARSAASIKGASAAFVFPEGATAEAGRGSTKALNAARWSSASQPGSSENGTASNVTFSFANSDVRAPSGMARRSLVDQISLAPGADQLPVEIPPRVLGGDIAARRSRMFGRRP